MKTSGIQTGKSGGERILEALIVQELRRAGVPPQRVEVEYRFHPDRRWRFDVAFPELRLALELDGGTWMAKGGHTTGTGAQRDREKDRAAVEADWHVLRITTQELERETGKIADQVVRIVKRKLGQT